MGELSLAHEKAALVSHHRAPPETRATCGVTSTSTDSMIPHQPNKQQEATSYKRTHNTHKHDGAGCGWRFGLGGIMGEGTKRNADKPPARRGRSTAVATTARAVKAHRDPRAVGIGRRGRLSQGDYVDRIGDVLRKEIFELEECTSLVQLPGVQALARRHRDALFPAGLALRQLFDRAVADVRRYARAGGSLLSLRIAEFLRIWYEEGDTVVRVAHELKLSRSYVVHDIQRPARALVAKRFLELASRVEAPV